MVEALRWERRPQLRAPMMNVMGSVYQNLGLYSKSESLAQKALEVQRRTLGEKDPATLSSMNLLAFTIDLQGRYPEAETLARQAVATTLPGFQDFPDAFLIDEYGVDEDEWTTGFESVPYPNN